MEAYSELLSKMVGLVFLMLPCLLKANGTVNLGISTAILGGYTIVSAWMMNESSKYFVNESIKIKSLHDLTYLCFGDHVIVFQEIIKIMISSMLLVCYNIYLGKESLNMLCGITEHMCSSNN